MVNLSNHLSLGIKSIYKTINENKVIEINIDIL